MPGPRGGGDFLEQLLGDLLGLMGSSTAGSANQLELARTLAHSVASGGQPEPNVEPLARMELEQISRIAELHVVELTGLPVTPDGSPVEIVAVGPGAWAWHTLEDWRFLLEAMSPGAQTPQKGQQTPPTSPSSEHAPPETRPGLGLVDLGPNTHLPEQTESQGPADLLARFMSTMGPMLIAMQLGSAVGHLARTALGPYEVPIPRPGPRILIVPQNLERFAADWSLPLDQVRLWVCLRELTAHSVLTRTHVASRFRYLLTNVVNAVAADSAGVMDRLGGLDPTDPEALQSLLGDPEALLGAEPSPARRHAGDELAAAMAALLGFVEHVLDRAATRLLGGRTALTEAWRRRQHDRETAERATELLLGLDLGPAQVDRGVAFVSGILERAGDEGLAMLWSPSHALPTPSEIEAPGLWLERVRIEEEAPRDD